MPVELPARDYSAYIFDCDGTLANTMPLHYRAWTQTFQDYNAPFTFEEEEFYFLGGTPAVKIVELLNNRHGTAFDIHQVSHHKEMQFMRLIDQVQPIHDVVAIARQLAAAGKLLAVASGGVNEVVMRTLRLLDIAHLFHTIVTSEQVAHGKPFPDMFLLAAARLNAPPAQCLVFEDTPIGAQAAQAAGMDYLIVPRPSK